MSFSIKQLQELKDKGLIKGFILPPAPQGGSEKSQSIAGSPKKGAKIKGWMQLQLEFWADVNHLVLLEEFQFDSERKWRFDWAIPSRKLAFEYEGINASKSRHTTQKGYTGDAEKYNEAARQGWRVFRYTSLNHKSLIRDLGQITMR